MNTSTYSQWMALRASEPELRALDIAGRLGITEAELVHSAVGQSDAVSATRLRGPLTDILTGFNALGPMKALTRNPHAVCEIIGTYPKLELVSSSMGQTVGEIDLRAFFGRWAHAFAVTEQTKRGERRSIQFFDASGRAIHKAYATQETDVEAFSRLVDRHRHESPDEPLTIEPAEKPRFDRPDSEIDVEAFRREWLAMRDTHDFYPLLQRLQIDRVQAMRLAGEDLARPIALDAADTMLRKAAETGTPIMVFVANPALVQIYIGKVNKVVPLHGWLNVLDPKFNLHLRPDAVQSAWVVRKPTPDDTVTSLELYDESGELIVTFFGERHEGEKEQTAWRAILDALPAAS